MSFSASWLALREPYDHAARAPTLSGQLREFLRTRGAGPVRIIDLACGTGSNLRYLAPRLGGAQQWTMVDNDPALLALLRGMPDAGVEAVRCDLARDLHDLAFADCDVVTASALLDLVSPDWLDRLLAALAPPRAALLFALSYDGSMRWEPALPDDRRITAWFNLHQRTDKGFGAALGPDAAAEAGRRLEAAGFRVTTAGSDWHLATRDRTVQREVAAGVAEAVVALPSAGGDAAAIARAWLEARRSLIDAGRGSLRVGHTDLLALPAASDRR